MGSRGRGSGLSFNTEVLGFGRGDLLPSNTLAPPPLFPALANKPVKLLEDDAHKFMLTAAKDLRHQLKTSKFYLGDINDPDPKPSLHWNLIPEELRPRHSRSRKNQTISHPNLAKKRKIDIAKKLDSLEKSENTNDKRDSEDEQSDKDSDEEDKGSARGSDVEPDEEMDGGTDYAANYFDNGEGFLDEDDDEEGGIY